jgi:hypothetical protein
MLFIQKLLEKKQDAQSLTKLIDKRIAGFEEQRTHKIVHISDLSKGTGFCPREFALLDVTKKKPKGMYVSMALQVTFDNGSALSDLCRNKWLEHDVVGNWRCLYCKRVIGFSKKPKVSCKCGATLWRYEEVTLVNPANGVSGSIDFLVDLGMGKHTMVECKSLARDTFDTLKAPLAEHRVRTQLYLMHGSLSTGPCISKVNWEQGIVFYISKGYGVKNEEYGGKIIPFKEFVVERDDAAVKPLYTKADPLHAFRNGGTMPEGICATSFEPRVKGCPVAIECWSGKHPAGV